MARIAFGGKQNPSAKGKCYNGRKGMHLNDKGSREKWTEGHFVNSFCVLRLVCALKVAVYNVGLNMNCDKPPDSFVKYPNLHFALREMRAQFTSPIHLVVLVAVGVVLGLAGPFQTFDALRPGGRIAYWVILVIVCYGLGVFINALWRDKTGAHLIRPWWLSSLASGLVLGIVVGITVYTVNWLTFGWQVADHFDVAETFLYCTLIAVSVTLAFSYFEQHAQKSHSAHASPPKIIQRLPHNKRGQLISMSMQDHYVAVTTTHGTELVLLRLADAIDETNGVAGSQIHRSHWVAHSGIASMKKDGGKWVVVTTIETELPVSRSFAPVLKQAGFSPAS